jgi:FtsP/CotA-like multicopper oxidase with cupredoxin domain/peroxiredoxin
MRPHIRVLLGILWVAGFVPGALAQEPAAHKPQAADAGEQDAAQRLREYTKGSRDRAQASRLPFANPPEIRGGSGPPPTTPGGPSPASLNGPLQTTLVVDYANNRIGDTPVRLRSYSGSLVGPTLRIRPGNRLSIRLINDLPDEPPGAHADINKPHGFFTTNLHTHGLHVSPEDNSDNVLLEVPPRGRQDYRFDIGAGHLPGTYWYHPHKHGSVGIQVSSGMAGALIVEGGLDDVPEIQAARERIFVFQQIPFTKAGTFEGRNFDEIDNWPSRPDLHTTINGLLQPVIEMAPGEVERWRFIHAGVAIRLDVEFDPIHGSPALGFYEIAADGIALGRKVTKPRIDLSPGYRSDVLVKLPDKPGEYEYLLIDRAQSASRSLRDKSKPEDALARVVIRGPAKPMQLPGDDTLSKLPKYPNIPPSQKKRTLEFDGAGAVWKIDGKQFNPNQYDQCPVVGTSEEWTLVSKSQKHPFHIHVNPFQVISIGTETLKPPLWKDTILLEPGKNILLRIRFDDLPGKTVLHCHKLDHEDQGMMQLIQILPNCTEKVIPQSPKRQDEAAKQSVQAAPSWRLPDDKGRMRELSEFAGRPLVLVFFRGAGCLHCVQQLRGLADRRDALKAAGVIVVAIGSDPPGKDGSEGGGSDWPFPILADGDHHIFKRYGCYEGRPMHGVFIIDRLGQIRWQTISEAPFADVDRIVELVARLPAE